MAQLHVVLEEHESAQLLQHGLDGVLPAPPGQDGHSTDVNLGRAKMKLKCCRLEQLILHILFLKAKPGVQANDINNQPQSENSADDKGPLSRDCARLK